MGITTNEQPDGYLIGEPVSSIIPLTPQLEGSFQAGTLDHGLVFNGVKDNGKYWF